MLVREASASMRVQAGYWAVSQSKSPASWAAGNARVRVWLRWWWVFTRPGSTIWPARSRTTSAVGGQLARGADLSDEPVDGVEPGIPQLAPGRVHGDEPIVLRKEVGGWLLPGKITVVAREDG